ncbi:MAG: VanZ family protein [Acidobacteriota bacterium]|nr:MAG: VanZ family protein [Acidobacteriota bacterium]
MRDFLHWIPTLVLAVAIFTVSHKSNPPGADLAPDYVAHFLAYGLFALTLVWGWTKGLKGQLELRVVPWLWVAATLYGVLDEVHQAFVPNRHPSFQDVLADSVGALVAVLGSYWILRVWKNRPEA